MKQISETTITLSQTQFDYTGGALKPTVTITDGDRTLTENSDYTLTFPTDLSAAGIQSITVTGIGTDYEGTTTVSYSIIKIKQMADLSSYMEKNPMPWTNAFVRADAFPIEKYSIFPSLSAAKVYASGGGNVPELGGKINNLAYEGQLIAVTEDGQQVAYVIDHSATDGIRRVGSDPGTVCAEISGIVEGYIGNLNVSDISAGVGKMVDKIWETNGLISATYRDLSTSEVQGFDTALATKTVSVVSAEPEGDAYATYHVTQNGTKVGTSINIPKDKVISSAYMVAVTGEPESATSATISAFTVKYDNIVCHILSDDTGTEKIGTEAAEAVTFAAGTFASIKNAYFGKEGGDGPYLRITVSNQDCPIYIAMPKLVDTYFGGNTDTISVDVNASTRTITAIVRPGSIGTEHLSADAVTNAKLADSAVQTENIADANVTTEKIADNAVTNDKIADNAVATVQLSSAAVTTAKIANGAVTSDKLATDSVTTDKIQDSSVTTPKLADNAVTNAKLSAGAVATVNIQTGAVTEGKIGAKAVTEGKIDDAAVSNVKIANEAVNAAKLSADAVTTVKIKDANVTKAKLADDVIAWGESLSTKALDDAKAYTNGVSATLSTELTEQISTAKTELSAYARETSANALAEAKTYADNVSSWLSGQLTGDISVAGEALSAYARETSAAAYEKALTDAKAYTNGVSAGLSAELTAQISGVSADLSNATRAEMAVVYTQAISYTDSVSAGLSSALTNDINAARTALSAYARETSAAAYGAAIISAQAVHDELTGYVQYTDVLDGKSAITGSNKIVTQKDIAALTGVMHFKGVATNNELSTGSTVVPVPPYATTADVPVQGDFVIDKVGSEFVWALSTGTSTSCWFKVGDETIYAKKSELEAETTAREDADTYISGVVDNKVKVGSGSYDGTTETYSLSNQTSLSVVKIADEDYYKLVAAGKQDDNVIYVVSSDYVNGHDQRVINVGTAVSATDAVNLSVMTDAIAEAKAEIVANSLSGVKLNGISATVANNIASLSIDIISCGSAA